jgi:hypothetical protein
LVDADERVRSIIEPRRCRIFSLRLTSFR